MLLRTIMAPIPPSVASYIQKMRAMARERPAVMKRPAHLAAMPSEPIEEYLDVHVVTMQIVQVNDTGINLLELGEEPPRRSLGMEARAIIKTRLQDINVKFNLRTEVDLSVILGSTSTSPHAPKLVTGGKLLPLHSFHHGAC